MRKNFLIPLSVILIAGFTFSYIIFSKKSFSEYIVKKDRNIYKELLNNPTETILKYIHLPYNYGYGSRKLFNKKTHLPSDI